jgi:hypothetical protein
LVPEKKINYPRLGRGIFILEDNLSPMKTKDFFRLIIKLFGFYLLVISIFKGLPNTLLPYFYFSNGSNGDWLPSFWPIAMAAFLIVLFLLLTFNPDFFIKNLKLDKGFDSDVIKLDNLNAKTILNLGIILIGGFLLIDSISPLLSSSYYLIKSRVATSEEIRIQSSLDVTSYVKLGANLLNIIIGYLLLSNYHFISGFLLPKRDDADQV